jgi:hypothetical protein
MEKSWRKLRKGSPKFNLYYTIINHGVQGDYIIARNTQHKRNKLVKDNVA